MSGLLELSARGSLWNRWDLHVHTPASIVHDYPGSEDEAWDHFLADVEALPSEFRVIGINDYLFLDGYRRVVAERSLGRLANIDLVLPVIELRLNVFGGTDSKLSKVNYHVIFSDQLDPQVIQEQFLNTLSSAFKLIPGIHASAWKGVLTRGALEDLGAAIIDSVSDGERPKYGSALHEGFSNFTVSLEAVEGALDSSFLEGHYVTAVGKTEWADIKWKSGSVAEKKHVINSADCVFTAAESPSTYERARTALVEGEVNGKLLDCSDAHHLSSSGHKDRIGNCLTWIKADPTFGGLLQGLEEFDQRMFVGNEPTQLRRVREHPSKYVDRVRVRKLQSSQLPDEWFNVDLPLSSGLIAVIGNKGSGKSALAEVIGLAGGSPHEDHFSFLTPSRFRDTRLRLAENFEGELLWRDGEDSAIGLADSVDPGGEVRIQHLPQRYLESLCTEVPQGDKTRFDDELERIIFAHLPVDRRLGTATLRELTAVSTGSLDKELAEHRTRLDDVNAQIAAFEEDQRPEVLRARKAAYQALRGEWYTLRQNPPTRVPEPDEADPALSAVRDRIRELDLASKHLEDLLEHSESSLATIRRQLADLATFRASLEALEREHATLRSEHRKLLEVLGIADDVSSFTINVPTLDDARERLSRSEGELVELIAGPRGSKQGLRDAIKWIDQESAAERARLSAPEESREAYLKLHSKWEADVAALLGTPQSVDTGTVLGARRSYFLLSEAPGRLAELRSRRRELALDIHRSLVKKAGVCSALYEPLQTYMDSHELPSDYELSVGTSLVDTGFADVLLGELLNRHVAGSFCGVAESSQRLNDLLAAVDFDDEESTLAFLTEIDEQLHFDKRQGTSEPTQPADQIRKGKTVADVYNWVFGLEYLDPRYGLLFGGKPIYQLSPGEKGTLLLVFFLLAELDTKPLVIDQPEDNLDNNTVYRALVKCFESAKERRQVMIVTHNPNLAVVCDADQIIVATIDKANGNKVSYEPGAIERLRTVEAVVDILEGTQPAFSNRSVKYGLHLLRHSEGSSSPSSSTAS